MLCLPSYTMVVSADQDAQPGSQHGRCAIEPRSAGYFYVSRQYA